MKSSMKNDIAFYSGEKGEGMKEAYTMLGQYQAELESAQEMYKRKALSKMLDSDEYKAAKAAGDDEKMTELVALAQSQAQNDYYASELYQNNMNMEERLLTATRRMSAESTAQLSACTTCSRSTRRGTGRRTCRKV